LSVVIRSWNVFHGRSHPPDRRLSVEEAVRLVSSGEPTIVCLQELPVWSLAKLEAWSGMTSISAVTVRPSVGPVPIPATLGRRLVQLDPPRLRSAFCGQGNAVLVSRVAHVLDSRTLALNDAGFRRAQGRRLQLDFATRLAWAKERRVCQTVRLVLPDGRRALVANLHASALGFEERLADAELLRAASFADALADPRDLVVLAGDFNVVSGRSATLETLTTAEWRFSPPGPGLDQILVRGVDVVDLHAWPLERRRVSGRLLSDHAPVEATVA
jgi:endonuclease/exonuclease/phosphatase family metal-dependent hydrolase